MNKMIVGMLYVLVGGFMMSQCAGRIGKFLNTQTINASLHPCNYELAVMYYNNGTDIVTLTPIPICE